MSKSFPIHETKAAPVFDNQDGLDIYNSPIAISDATSMFRRKMEANFPPYTATVVKYNNSMIDKWEKDMLVPMSKNGKLPAGKISHAWKVFESEAECAYFDQSDLIPRPDEKQLERMVKFLTGPFEDMIKKGSVFCMAVFQTVMLELNVQLMEQRMDKVFDGSDNPVDWWMKSQSNKQLFDGTYQPFLSQDEIRDIKQRISTISSYKPTVAM